MPTVSTAPARDDVRADVRVDVRVDARSERIQPVSRRAQQAPGPLAIELCRSADVIVLGVAMLTAVVVANLPHGFAATAQGVQQLLSRQLTFGGVLVLAVYAILWRQAFVLVGLYADRPTSGLREVVTIAAACGLGTLLLLSFPLVHVAPSVGLGLAMILWSASTLAAVSARLVIRRLVATRRAESRHVVIVGSGPRAMRLYGELCDHPETGHHLVGFVDDCFDHGPEIPIVVRRHALGTIEDFERVMMHTVVDEVLIALPVRSQYAQIQRVIDVCARIGVECRYPVDIFQSRQSRHARPLVDARTGVVEVRLPPVATDARLAAKRALDVVGASIGLLALAPLLILVAIAVRVTSPGPAIFVQERYGYRKRHFRMYKFRTMVSDAEALQPMVEAQNEQRGPIFKIRVDPRVTPLGRFLRESSLDELPQLVNVLLGHMSLVGPRPMSTRDVGRFAEPWLMRRFSVKPGLTCLWQVSGRSNLTFDDWIALDLDYIDRWSLGLDAQILVRTVPAVLRRVGAV